MFYLTNMKPYETKLLNDEDSVQAFEKMLRRQVFAYNNDMHTVFKNTPRPKL